MDSGNRAAVHCGHHLVSFLDEVKVQGLVGHLWEGEEPACLSYGCSLVDFLAENLGPFFAHVKLDVGVCRVTHPSLLRTSPSKCVLLVDPECGSFCSEVVVSWDWRKICSSGHVASLLRAPQCA